MSIEPDAVDPVTWLVTGGRPTEPGAPLNHPIVAASTFAHGDARIYSRADATEGWEALEAVLGGLEGADALVFASGMAAAAAVFELVPLNGRVVIPDDCYYGVAAIAQEGQDAGRWTASVVPAADTNAWITAMADADLVWVETPTNPLLEVTDLAALGSAPRPDGSVLVVDNTFATALRQRPLDMGADVTMQSSTKFIGGHGDLLGGVLATRDTTLQTRLRAVRSRHGATPGSLETFLALRGVRTMAMRLDRAEENARALHERLGGHPDVVRSRYPGFGAVLSFEVADAATADRLCERLRVIRHATSLGGVETLIERRGRYAGQEHVPAGLLRLSVGCEAVDDLWTDLSGALEG